MGPPGSRSLAGLPARPASSPRCGQCHPAQPPSSEPPALPKGFWPQRGLAPSVASGKGVYFEAYKSSSGKCTHNVSHPGLGVRAAARREEGPGPLQGSLQMSAPGGAKWGERGGRGEGTEGPRPVLDQRNENNLGWTRNAHSYSGPSRSGQLWASPSRAQQPGQPPAGPSGARKPQAALQFSPRFPASSPGPEGLLPSGSFVCRSVSVPLCPASPPGPAVSGLHAPKCGAASWAHTVGAGTRESPSPAA